MARMRTLTASDSGRTITVTPSEEIMLVLPENPTTGYRWSITITGAALTPLTATYEPPDAGIGGGGTRSFHYRANAAGSTRLDARLRRSWDAPETAIDECTVTITVGGAHAVTA